MDRFDDLLNRRICDLNLRLQDTPLQDRVDQLHGELLRRNLRFRPSCYFADEWFVPEGDTVIGIPFYLASKRLMRIEKTMMGEVEGETKEHCMRLLRHEAGHAISYAYKLFKKKSYVRVFGSTAKLFMDHYKFNPKSRRFVIHLGDHYAQSHPDEDFAETFAVWLSQPEDAWRKRYRTWPALRKLEYVKNLMAGIQGKRPLVRGGEKMCHVSTLRYTLWTYYMRRRSLVDSHPRV